MKTSKNLFRLNQSGSAMIAALMVTGAVLLAGAGMIQWQHIQKNQISRLIASGAVHQIRAQVISYALNDQSWAKTIQYNSSIIGSSSLASLYNGNGVLFYKSSDPKAGFGVSGDPCSAFDEQAGNDSCPFRYDLQIVSTDEIRGTFKFRAKNFGLGIPPTSFDFVVNRKSTTMDVKSTCLAAGGIFDSSLKSCSIRFDVNQSCYNGALFQGVVSRNCTVTPAQVQGSCGLNQVVGAIVNGRTQCISRDSYL